VEHPQKTFHHLSLIALLGRCMTVTAGRGLTGGGPVALGRNVILTNTGVLGINAGTGLTTTGGQIPTLSVNQTVVPLLAKRAFVSALQRLVPEVRNEDLAPAGTGVRAQALKSDGTLVDDFQFFSAERTLHVLNVPSPAATASGLIAPTTVDTASTNLGLV